MRIAPRALAFILSGTRLITRWSTSADTDAAMLEKHAAAFKHLVHLDVSENMLTGKGKKKLAKLCASVAAGNQREYYADTDDENNRCVPSDEQGRCP